MYREQVCAGNSKYLTYQITIYILSLWLIGIFIRKLIKLYFRIFAVDRCLSTLCIRIIQQIGLLKCKKLLTNIQNVLNFIPYTVRVRITHIACFILLVIRVIFVFEPEWDLVLLNLPPLVLLPTSSLLFQV